MAAGVRPLWDARFTCAELCVRNSIPCHLCDDVSPPWASCHPCDGVGHVMAVGELDFICSHSCHAQPLRCRTLVSKCSPVITEPGLLGGPVMNGPLYLWPVLCMAQSDQVGVHCRTFVSKDSPVKTESDFLGGPVLNGLSSLWPERH